MLHLGIAAASKRAVTASGANAFSDDFSGTLGNWTQDNITGWTIASGALTFPVGTAYQESTIRYSAATTGTVTQYGRITLTLRDQAANSIGLMFRSASTDVGYKYILQPYNGTLYFNRVPWDMSTYTEIDTATFAFSVGNTLAATCQGIGTGTIIKAWLDPTNNTPYDKDNWDSASDPADITLTDGGGLLATNKADTGLYVGVHAWRDSSGYASAGDNFYGGGL